MKPSEIILSLIVLVLIGVITVGLLEIRKEDQLKQATIEGLRKELKECKQ